MSKALKISNVLDYPRKKEPMLAREAKFPVLGADLNVADPDAVRALVALMDMEAVLGGAASHFGGPAALAEINSALYAYAFRHGKEWKDHFNLINDAGHCENGLYALKALYEFAELELEDLKKFRSIESPLTGHGEVHVFRKGVQLSNGPLGSSVAQAQGLALGDQINGNQKTTVLTLSDGGAMEGEAREALASIPGMAAKGYLNPFVVIISDNNTKLSHRIDEDSFSMKPSFDSLETLGWNVFKDLDGHDLNKVAAKIEEGILAARENPKKPVVLHFKTVKGFGFKKAMESASGGHGFPLKTPADLRQMITEIYKGPNFPEPIENWLKELETRDLAKSSSDSTPKEKIQVGVAKALIDLKKEGFPLISVSSDLYGSTGLGAFRKEFPESSYDVGIAESNMVSVAAGLSKTGFIPLVDTFAQFGVTKGSLPLIMANLSEAPVIAFFSHTGFQDAADGASHQSLTYFSKIASIPYTDVVSLSCSSEAYELVTEVIKKFKQDVEAGKTPRSTVFFLGRENFPQKYTEGGYKLSEEKVLMRGGSDSVLLTTGSLVPLALKAAEGTGATVVSKSHVNAPFSENFKQLLNECGGNLIVAEDHQQISGFGAFTLMKLTEQFGAGAVKNFKHLAVQGHFGRSAYKASQLYEQNHIGETAMKEALGLFS